MKNFDTLVGKYVRVSEKYVALFFPKEQKSRLRQDDMEMVYWNEYPMIGSGYYNTKFCLFYDQFPVSYQTQQFAKASNYKTDTKSNWERDMFHTVFSPSFGGVVNETEFWKAIGKLYGRI